MFVKNCKIIFDLRFYDCKFSLISFVNKLISIFKFSNLNIIIFPPNLYVYRVSSIIFNINNFHLGVDFFSVKYKKFLYFLQKVSCKYIIINDFDINHIFKFRNVRKIKSIFLNNFNLIFIFNETYEEYISDNVFNLLNEKVDFFLQNIDFFYLKDIIFIYKPFFKLKFNDSKINEIYKYVRFIFSNKYNLYNLNFSFIYYINFKNLCSLFFKSNIDGIILNNVLCNFNELLEFCFFISNMRFKWKF